MENYFLNVTIASRVLGRSDDEIRRAILGAIHHNKHKILKKNKFFEFLLNSMKPEDITDERIGELDASEILETFVSTFDLDRATYISRFVEHCAKERYLEAGFPKPLLEALQSARALGPELVDSTVDRVET